MGESHTFGKHVSSVSFSSPLHVCSSSRTSRLCATAMAANRFSDTRNRANLATDESNYVECACMFAVFLFWSGSRFLQSRSIWKVKCEK